MRFLYSDPFDIGGVNNEVGFVFQNPARILPVQKELQMTAAISSAPDFFGYDQLSFASQVSRDNIAIGFGMVSFSTDGIEEADLNSDNRPEATGGTFADEMTRFSAVAATRIHPQLQIGAQLTYFGRDLGDNSVSYLGLDGGAYYTTSYGLGLGVYTQGLLHRGYQWDDSTSEEELDRRFVAEADYQWRDFWSRLSTDFSQSRLLLQYRYGSQFGVHADAVADNNFAVSRYGVGTSVGLGRVQLVYWYHLLQTESVDTVKHEFGLRFAI